MNMNQEDFIKTLEELTTLASQQGNMLTKEQLKEALDAIDFPNNEKSDALIKEYLTANHIGIDEAIDPKDFMSEHELDYLEEYLSEVKALGEVSDGEKRAITMSALAGDLSAQQRLIEVYLPYVAEVAKLYAGFGVLLEDLIGEGNVALTESVEMLECVETPEEVEGFLGSRMMEAMESFIKENADAKKEDEKMVSKVNRIAEMVKALSDDLGRDVTPEEVAEENHISKKSVLDAMRISGDKIEGLSGEGAE